MSVLQIPAPVEGMLPVSMLLAAISACVRKDTYITRMNAQVSYLYILHTLTKRYI